MGYVGTWPWRVFLDASSRLTPRTARWGSPGAYDPLEKQVVNLYQEANISDGFVDHSGTIEDLVTSLWKVPLVHHPGEVFSYGLSADVLGRLVEVLSGQTFDAYLRDHIFEPLGMADTYFCLPPEKASRLVSLYKSGENGLIEAEGDFQDGAFFYSSTFPLSKPCTYFSGGGGLVSTAEDYAIFLQMLLNGGKLNGHQLLSPTTVHLMTIDHLDEIPFGVLYPGSGGFGLGFGLHGSQEESGEIYSEGSYYWLGLFNTKFWVDPEQELIGIMLNQMNPFTRDLETRFEALTYQAIVE